MLKSFIREDDGLSKDTRKEERKMYQKSISGILNPLKEAKIPVVVIVDGWDSSGKGHLINQLIDELDPRFWDVFVDEKKSPEASRYPFMYPYYKAMPENGKLLFMDSSYLSHIVMDDLSGNIDAKEKKQRIKSVNIYERQLKNNGYLIIKFFINISKDKQSKSQKALLSKKDSAFRVTKSDLFQNKHYEEFLDAYDDALEKTNTIPWHVLDGDNRKTIAYDAFKILYKELHTAITMGKYCAHPYEETFIMSDPLPRTSDADLSLSISEDEYWTELKRLQDSIHTLQGKMYRRRIPMLLCYEGWDAAGKGGNIRRVAKPFDPRSFRTIPISSPLPHEKNRLHLWRFWSYVPKDGHVTIFDRTWYGRVMVERIEGFCSEDDWKRAYNEINEFEKELTEWGAVVLKFWIQIDKDTQLARFTERQNTPEKMWKITDEDWRNRDKWDEYEIALNEMLEKTSTEFAPWHIIESNDKLYARIKTLRIIEAAMKKALERK